MAETTIGVSNDVKERLRDERLENENSYDETIKRLLGMSKMPYVTEERARKIVREEAREIANEQITERVAPKAQR